LAPSLEETSYTPCPRCNGIGHIRGTESSALNILRIIQEEAMKEHSAAIHVQVPVDVATFLLNEKRSDIHRIESRLKVSITLIPNQHMETPHYSVARLRQDDMTSENQQASYKLVERPEEGKDAAAAQETKAQRPQAAVQGITPAQPAPIRAVEVAPQQPSLISRFFGWFTSKSKDVPAEKVEVAKPRSSNAPRRDRDGNRPEGNRPEGNRQDGNRQRNKPRRDRDDASRTEKPARPEAAPKAQEPRTERPPRPPRVAVEKPALESVTKADAAAPEQTDENGNRAGRKRGRRGGQRERERREQQTAEPGAGEQPTNNAAGNDAPVAVENTRHNITTEHTGIESEQRLSPVAEQSHAEQQIAPATVVTERQVEPVAQFVAPALVPAPAPAYAPVQANLPIVDSGLTASGLVQIETAPSKLAAVAAVPAEIAQQPATRRRPRQREVYSMESNTPLVQIETQHTPH
jgi:ribonuclease E